MCDLSGLIVCLPVNASLKMWFWRGHKVHYGQRTSSSNLIIQVMIRSHGHSPLCKKKRCFSQNNNGSQTTINRSAIQGLKKYCLPTLRRNHSEEIQYPRSPRAQYFINSFHKIFIKLIFLVKLTSNTVNHHLNYDLNLQAQILWPY